MPLTMNPFRPPDDAPDATPEKLVLVNHGASRGYSIYGYWPAPGEILKVNIYEPGIQSCIRNHYLSLVDPRIPLLVHQPTGRQFGGPRALEQYARDYANPEMRTRYPQRYEPLPSWRMVHSLRSDPDGIDLKQGELITPAHPAFLILYADSLVSHHPLMVRELASAAPQPQPPLDTRDGVAAYFIEQQNWSIQGEPVAQATDVSTLITQLWIPPWELCYELGTEENALRALCDARGIAHHYRKVIDIRTVELHKGERILVRVRDDSRLGWIRPEYFRVRSVPLPVEAIPNTVLQPASSQAPARKTSGNTPGSGKEYADEAVFRSVLIAAIDDTWRRLRKNGKRPTAAAIRASKCWDPGIGNTTLYNRCKDYRIALQDLITSRKDIALSR